jgi:hypothetical protein
MLRLLHNLSQPAGVLENMANFVLVNSMKMTYLIWTTEFGGYLISEIAKASRKLYEFKLSKRRAQEEENCSSRRYV